MRYRTDDVYRENDWCIVDRNDARGPWIVHRCEGPVLKSFPEWNHVVSGNDPSTSNSLYCCLGCYRKAPDSMITVFELYR
jgi:hypothetical protein